MNEQKKSFWRDVLLAIVPVALQVLAVFGIVFVWHLYKEVQKIEIVPRYEYGFLVFMPIAGILFWWWAYRMKYPADEEDDDEEKVEEKGKPKGNWFERHRKKWWWRENEAVVLIFFVIVNFGIYTVWPEWWTQNVGKDHRIWVLHISAILLAGLVPHGDVPFHHKLGWIGSTFMITLMFIVWFKYPNETAEVKAAKAKAFADTQALVAENSIPLPRNNAVAETTKKFWRENLSPESEALEMIEIAKRESDFNQFEKNGSPYRGRVNRQDVGVMQINEGYWLAQSRALGYNIYNLDGNLKMALWIREHYGSDEWNTSVEARIFARQKPTLIEGPVGAWSEAIDVSRAKCHGEPDKKMEVKADNGNIYILEPGHIPDFKTNTVWYMSTEEPPGKVTLTCG